jgi:DNA-binding NarL/FixJ family response regulator
VLRGRPSAAFDALRRRLAADPSVELVDGPDDAGALVTVSTPDDGGDPVGEPLTARERDVLALAAEGMVNREIAAALGLSEHTVKFHLAAIFGKLGVATRTEAVRRALRRGLIDI